MSLTFTSVLFKRNPKVPEYGRRYNASWGDKLYRGLARHHKNPRLVIFTDQPYKFAEPIEQIPLSSCEDPSWLSCMDMFRLDGTVLGMGLDTIITGNMDPLAEYTGELALCEDQYQSPLRCNGVMLFNNGPAIWKKFQETEHPEKFKLSMYPSELTWLRQHYPRCETVDQFWPGWFCSVKWHILKGAFDPKVVRAVFFHGGWKPDNIGTHIDCPEFLRAQWV